MLNNYLQMFRRRKMEALRESVVFLITPVTGHDEGQRHVDAASDEEVREFLRSLSKEDNERPTDNW